MAVLKYKNPSTGRFEVLSYQFLMGDSGSGSGSGSGGNNNTPFGNGVAIIDVKYNTKGNLVFYLDNGIIWDTDNPPKGI